MSITALALLAYFAAVFGVMMFFYLREQIWWKPLLILLAFSLCTLMLWNPAVPYYPNDRLKRGIDLAGGTVLTYDVNLPASANPDEVIGEMISILSNRVDPTGTSNLIWRQVAGNRIEVQMAQPSDTVRQLREDYYTAKDSLLDEQISLETIDAALRLEGQARLEQLREIAGSNDEMIADLVALGEASDGLTVANADYNAVRQQLASARAAFNEMRGTPDAPAAALEALQLQIQEISRDILAPAQALNEAQAVYDAAFEQVSRNRIEPFEIDRLLALSNEVEPGATQSARAQASDRLIEQHPTKTEKINTLLAASDAYASQKGSVDSPEDLKVLLRSSGVLEFRIAAEAEDTIPGLDEYRERLAERGPRAGADQPWRWFPVDDIQEFYRTERPRVGDTVAEEARAEEIARLRENPAAFFASAFNLIGDEYDNTYYLLLSNQRSTAMTKSSGNWEVTDVGQGQDNFGRPTVNFTLDVVGGQLMSGLTSGNVGKPLSILLDGKVAANPPNIRDQLSRQIQISGEFTQQEIDFLRRTLKAGSLDASLSEEPISEIQIGPSMGADNLAKGLNAAIDSLILVAIFMILYYFLGGVITAVALLGNVVIILGVMSMLEATFTLPGIAGIVLTIGMAVDANVLIFERIREELARDVDLPVAIRLGYEKAFYTIVDANITTLITCIVLGWRGTPEIKGFAYTLGIGILATLFTALFCTRVVLDLYLRLTKAKSLPMLPISVPVISRILSPNVNWISKRYFFFVFSVAVIGTGISLAFLRGEDMLDIEFRSGTQVTFTLKEGAEPMTLAQVRERIDQYGQVGELMNDPAFAASSVPAELQTNYTSLAPIVEVANARRDQAIAEGTVGEEEGPIDFGLLTDNTIQVTSIGESADGDSYSRFSVASLITDPQAVSAVLLSAFDDVLDAKPSLNFEGSEFGDDELNLAPVRPITTDDLGSLIGRPDIVEDVSPYIGGVVVTLEQISPPATLDDISERINAMRQQPAFEGLPSRRWEVVGLDVAAEAGVEDGVKYSSAVVVSTDGITNYQEQIVTFNDALGLAITEWQVVKEAMLRSSALDAVNSFSSQVSQTMKQDAIVAMALSLLAVVAYIWLRFGSIRYGLAAIFALVHDIAIAIGLIAICGWVYELGIAKVLLLDPFRIDLVMVSAFLTIVGYSLNDTIVVFDRIRENRGRLAEATPEIINESINQTISRTVLTSGTTLFAVAMLYLFGGPGVHGFAFTMLIGVIIGTYSSVAIASPILVIFSKKQPPPTQNNKYAPAPTTDPETPETPEIPDSTQPSPA